jgi:thymidylate synthase
MEMIEKYVHRNSTNAFLIALAMVKEHGDIVSPRGYETKELLNQKIIIIKPWERCIVLPSRNDDIVAKVAETLWMLAGRDDIDWLKWYVPRAPTWSDDGKAWRGAYGPRLRNWRAWRGDNNWIDQIDVIARKLVEDPSTRQAIINIWNPEIDLEPGKDIPCNNWLHFFIRNEKLYMNVAQRSSDVVWGFSGIDAFSWSVLHEMMAHWVGVEMGDFTYFISSLHVYDRHYKRLDKILEDYADRTIYDFDLPTLKYSGDLIDLDHLLSDIFQSEEMMREDNPIVQQPLRYTRDELIGAFVSILMVGNLVKIHGDAAEPTTIAAIINQIPESDLRVAIVEWVSRKNLSVFPHLKLTDLEKQALSMTIPKIAVLLT